MSRVLESHGQLSCMTNNSIGRCRCLLVKQLYMIKVIRFDIEPLVRKSVLRHRKTKIHEVQTGAT